MLAILFGLAPYDPPPGVVRRHTTDDGDAQRNINRTAHTKALRSRNENAIIAAVNAGCDLTWQIEEETNLSQDTIRLILEELSHRGLITKVPRAKRGLQNRYYPA